MDPVIVTIVMRSIERLMVVAGASIAIWCGYRLFLAMPSRERGAGKLELPGGVSIHVSRVGPGVFFTLFGATILGLSLHYGVAVTNAPAPAAAVEPALAYAGHGKAVVTSAASYSGIGSAPGVTVPVDASRRTAVAVTVERLGRAAGSLDPSLDTFERGDIERALRTARVELLAAVWDEQSWGPLEAFRLWIAQGEPEPPPAIAGGVAAYRAGEAR